MFEDYEGKYIQFFLKENEAKVADISGIVERVDAITMPNGVVETIFVLNTGQSMTYNIPYRNVAFMSVSLMESGEEIGKQSSQGKSLGMTTDPSTYAKELVGKRSLEQADATESKLDEGESTEETSLGESRHPIKRITEKDMQVD